MSKNFKVGQVWKMRNGGRTTIRCVSTDSALVYPVTANCHANNTDYGYTLDGYMYLDEENEDDLVELVTESPTVDNTKKYTVDEVMHALFETGWINNPHHSPVRSQEVKEYLEKISDPQYQEFLRLKKIYEGSK